MKRWIAREDALIVEFFDTIGPLIGPRDLRRSKAATTARAKHLKTTGAWAALKRSEAEYQEYRKLAGFKSFGGLEQ